MYGILIMRPAISRITASIMGRMRVDDENPANEKQKTYEELLKQMEEGESGGEESANVEGIVIEE